jgi:hypothetical protein
MELNALMSNLPCTTPMCSKRGKCWKSISDPDYHYFGSKSGLSFTPASERGIRNKVHVRNCAIKTFQFSALSRKIRKLLNI